MEDTTDFFTPEFKRLKARNPCPDLSTVLDLGTNLTLPSDTKSQFTDEVVGYPVRNVSLRPVAGLKPCEEWKAYQFKKYPGLIIIQNPFVNGYQKYWVYRCLQDFPSHQENITNLSALGGERGVDLWQAFVQQKSSEFGKHDPLRKLRWTTLGYHYNWTSKEYSEEEKAEFPSDVKCLSQYLAACLGFPPYRAEAAIINYYHLDSTLAGHTDHSEIDHSAPLFSISFGQSAIFLMGGSTKAVRPMSVFLRSGDICVMSGDCRLAYHAVPKILAPSPKESILACFTLPPVGQQSSSNKLGDENRDEKQAKTNSSTSFSSTSSQTTLEPHKISAAATRNEIPERTISPLLAWDSAESAATSMSGDKLRTGALQSSAVDTKTWHVKSEGVMLITDNKLASCVQSNKIDTGGQHDNLNSATPAVRECAQVMGGDAESLACLESTEEANSQETAGSSFNKGKYDFSGNHMKGDILTYAEKYDCCVKEVNRKIEEVISVLDFTPFEVYLQSSRINMNIRQVLPSGWIRLPGKQCVGIESEENISKATKVTDSCESEICVSMEEADGTYQYQSVTVTTEKEEAAEIYLDTEGGTKKQRTESSFS